MLRSMSFARRTAGTVAAVTALALPAISSAQDNRPVVVVFTFSNSALGPARADFDGISTAVQDLLITDMAGNARIRLVDRSKISEVLQEQNMVKSGQVDPATAVRVGKIMGAQYAVTGGWVSDASGKATLTGRTIDIETTQIGNPQKVEGKSSDVLAMISELSTKLGSNLSLAPKSGRVGDASSPAESKPAQSGATPVVNAEHAEHAEASAAPALDYYAKPLSPAAKKVSVDQETLKLYSSAIAEIDKKNTAKAKELLQQVLKKYPAWENAQRQLAKLG